MIRPDEAKKLAEIERLLDEAYTHYFKHSDGHCKSSEGAVTVGFGTFFDRRDGDSAIKHVEIYSYVLGDGERLHTFDSVDAALETVRTWHRGEMRTTYDETGAPTHDNKEN